MGLENAKRGVRPRYSLALIFAAASLVAGLAPVSALAQESAAAEGEVEEIIVTAQKREQNIQEVPISITKMTGDRLEARFRGGADILALASAAPGLHVESSNGRLAPRFYMRGLGNADFTQAASQPVSIVFDEVPRNVNLNDALGGNPFDVGERIEVEKYLDRVGDLVGALAPCDHHVGVALYGTLDNNSCRTRLDDMLLLVVPSDDAWRCCMLR